MRTGMLVTIGAPLLVAVWLTSCKDESTPTGTAAGARPSEQLVSDQERAQRFQRDFNLERCTFVSEGVNPYFKLEPGYTLILAGQSEGEHVRLRIRVLDQTEQVNGVTTRVIEERETHDGELVEVSRNFFAICRPHNSVIYFGEHTDIYENGRVVSHEGSWRAGVNGARAGLFMAGLPLLGARYFQEVAPDVALDRAEIVEVNGVQRTPLRTFRGVLVTDETTPLEPGVRESKAYAPGVGQVRDDELLLVRFGFNLD
ncbi:MAG: hypothetical protein M3336_04355 [Chloroflexota bacterium]|nr:hypothetical protein [Chloroflexota bacterium]